MPLSNYASTNIIYASDYNDLRDLINPIFGTGIGNTGYGGFSQGPASVSLQDLPSVSIGDEIRTEPSSPGEWLNLRNAIESCALHQGLTLTDPLPSHTDLEVGDVIAAEVVGSDFVNFENLASTINSNQLTSNRFNPAIGNLTNVSVLTDIRSISWSSIIQNEFTVEFSNHDHARWFFNTGGQIIINTTHSGGSSTLQTQNWKNLINGEDPYIFDHIDYYAGTNTFQTIFTASGSGVYSPNLWTIEAKYDDTSGPRDAKGSILRIKSTFMDTYTSPHIGGSDIVDGNINVNISERRSVVIFPRPQPVYGWTVTLQ